MAVVAKEAEVGAAGTRKVAAAVVSQVAPGAAAGVAVASRVVGAAAVRAGRRAGQATASFPTAGGRSAPAGTWPYTQPRSPGVGGAGVNWLPWAEPGAGKGD